MNAPLNLAALASIPARQIPPNLRAQVDLLGEIGTYGEACIEEGALRARDRQHIEYGDNRAELLWPRIEAEVERLQGAEFERDQLRDASHCVLLVLSLLRPELDRMGCHAPRAVERFRAALSECKS